MGAFKDIDGQPVDKKFVMNWSWLYDDNLMILDDSKDDTSKTNVYLEIFWNPDQVIFWNLKINFKIAQYPIQKLNVFFMLMTFIDPVKLRDS